MNRSCKSGEDDMSNPQPSLTLRPYLESINDHCSQLHKEELTNIVLFLAKEVPAGTLSHPYQPRLPHDRALAAGQITAHPRCNPAPRPGILDKTTRLRGRRNIKGFKVIVGGEYEVIHHQCFA